MPPHAFGPDSGPLDRRSSGEGRGSDSDEGHIVDQVRVRGDEAALVVLQADAAAAAMAPWLQSSMAR